MNYEDWAQQLDEGLAMKEIQRMDKKTNRKKELAGKLEKAQKQNATKPLSASPEVIQARKNRKAKEANATPRLSASPDVQKARDKRLKSAPADKAADIVRNKTQTNKTPDDKGERAFQGVMKKIKRRKRNEQLARGKANRKDREDKASALSTANKKPGFGSGVKSSLGGDLIRRGDDAESITKRKEARNKMGKSVGDFMKKAPGRVVGTALKTKTSFNTGTSDSQDLSGPKKGVYNG